MSFNLRSKTAALLIFFFPFVSLCADSFLDDIHLAGLAGIFYFAADNGVNSDSAPIIPALGVSAGWQFVNFLRLELTEDIYFQNYEYNTVRGYPMACNPENRAALVIGFVTGIQLTGLFPVGEKGIQIRAYGGPAADIRLVLPAVSGAQTETDAIAKYFWSDARWFMPTVGFGMDFPLNEKFFLGFDLRTWVPVYKLWAKDGAPAVDGWRFGIGLRITPRKKPAEKKQDEETEDDNL